MVIYLTPAINKGRLTANQAIMAYNTGDKQPLGKLIKNGIQSIITRQKNSPSASTAAIDAEMARRMINMLDRDPELKAAAKQNANNTEVKKTSPTVKATV